MKIPQGLFQQGIPREIKILSVKFHRDSLHFTGYTYRMSQEKIPPAEGVEGLKRTLYSRTNQGPMSDVRSPLSPGQEKAPVSWGGPPPAHQPQVNQTEKKPGMSFAAKFFIGSALFFVVACGAALFMFFGGGNLISPRNIDVEIIAPSLIDGGKEASLQVIIGNRNAAPLLLADLILEYPEGTRNAERPTEDLTHERISLGTINPGQQIKQTARAIFFGEEGASHTVKATLEYSVSNSNAIFTKSADIAFTVGSSPVAISVKLPTQVTAGEPFDVAVTVQSNAATPLEHVAIEAQYPFGFSVSSASPSPASGSGLWRLGTMLPGDTKTITIRGSLEGQDGDERIFRFLAGSDQDETNTRIPVPFLTVPASLTVNRPFLGGSISLDGKTGKTVIASPGKVLQGSIVWENNLSESVSDIEVTLTFSGPVLDKNSITPGNGFYQSASNSIIWTKSQDPSLASVAPGGKGLLQFSFGTLAPGTGGVVYSNPTVTLSLGVKGVRQGQDTGSSQVSSVASMDVTLSSAVDLAAQTLRGGGYTNTGPTPPKAEQQTTYTVSWAIKNASNTVGSSVVSTVLPPYVTYITGQSGVTYDEGSRTVRWSLGDLAAGAGYSGSARQTFFQIGITPSLSQVGSAPPLTGTAQFSGTDRFAQVQVSASAAPVTTQTADGSPGVVVQ